MARLGRGDSAGGVCRGVRCRQAMGGSPASLAALPPPLPRLRASLNDRSEGSSYKAVKGLLAVPPPLGVCLCACKGPMDQERTAKKNNNPTIQKSGNYAKKRVFWPQTLSWPARFRPMFVSFGPIFLHFESKKSITIQLQPTFIG